MSSPTTTVTLRVLAVGLVGLAAAFGVEQVFADERSAPVETTTTTTTTAMTTPPTTSTITTTTVPADQQLCSLLSQGRLKDAYDRAVSEPAEASGDSRQSARARLGQDMVELCATAYRAPSQDTGGQSPIGGGSGESGGVPDGDAGNPDDPVPGDSGADQSGDRASGGVQPGVDDGQDGQGGGLPASGGQDDPQGAGSD